MRQRSKRPTPATACSWPRRPPPPCAAKRCWRRPRLTRWRRPWPSWRPRGLAEGGGLFPAVPGVAQPSAVAAARALGVPSGGLHLGQVIYAEPRLTPPSSPQPSLVLRVVPHNGLFAQALFSNPPPPDFSAAPTACWRSTASVGTGTSAACPTAGSPIGCAKVPEPPHCANAGDSLEPCR